jgi:multisubunit Na+/H+ antiporter MnhG subunit
MSFIAGLIAIIASFLLIVSAIAFFKAKNVFIMSHVVMASNCYIVPFFLITIGLEKFSWISFVKIIVVILLNLVIVNLICHATLRRAMINKIAPDAEIKSI